MYINLDYCLAT